jgi:hypothetical protein
MTVARDLAEAPRAPHRTAGRNSQMYIRESRRMLGDVKYADLQPHRDQCEHFVPGEAGGPVAFHDLA